MKVENPTIDPGNAIIGLLKRNMAMRRGRARLLKLLISVIPTLNNSRMVFTKSNIKLDLRNDAEIGLFFNGCSPHEKFFQETLCDFVDANTVFYDIGCNVGYYSHLLMPFVKEIYAFEPNPLLERRLVQMSTENDNVRFFNVGLSNVDSTLTFYYNSSKHDLGSFIDSGNSKHQSLVKVITLDKVIEENQLRPPTILKIDVEGYELEVLEGYKLLKRHMPIILMEWIHDKSMIKVKFEKLKQLIGDNYHIYAISGDEQLLAVYDGDISDYNSSNLLLLPQSLIIA